MRNRDIVDDPVDHMGYVVPGAAATEKPPILTSHQAARSLPIRKDRRPTASRARCYWWPGPIAIQDSEREKASLSIGKVGQAH